MFKIGIGMLLFGILLACASPGSWLAFVATFVGFFGLIFVIASISSDAKGDEISDMSEGSEENICDDKGGQE